MYRLIATLIENYSHLRSFHTEIRVVNAILAITRTELVKLQNEYESLSSI